MPMHPRPLFAVVSDFLDFTGTCPQCASTSRWQLVIESGRRRYTVQCEECGLVVSWNPENGTEQAVL